MSRAASPLSGIETPSRADPEMRHDKHFMTVFGLSGIV
jgi:hypothetical protein